MFEHSKTEEGVEFVCEGWTTTSQQKLVMVRNEDSVEVVTVENEACAKPKNKREKVIRQKCTCIDKP